MKIFDKRTIFTILITLLVLTGFFLLNNKSYALVENVPNIVSFKKSEIESNALKVELQSNNIGSDFSLEILNITDATRVNLAGSTTSYTFQNLEANKEYEIMVRACFIGIDKYSCTDYSPSVKATLGDQINSTESISDSGINNSEESDVETDIEEESDEEAVGEDYEGEFDNSLDEEIPEETIKQLGIQSVKLSSNKYKYNGKAKKPSVKVVNTDGVILTKNKHYTVKYSSGRKNIGTYKVTVKGKSGYSFTKKLSFVINPAPTKITSKSATKNSITVKYSSKGGGVSYQVGYKKSTASNYSSKSTSKTSLKISGLSKKTKYNLLVRTYKKVGSKTYYSSWSSVSSITTKSS